MTIPHTCNQVTVCLTLHCGHRRDYPMDLGSVAANPHYLRPGKWFPCGRCGKWWPRMRLVTATLYGYHCEPCSNGPAKKADQERPPDRPYQHHHAAPSHGGHAIAGYAIVGAYLDRYGPIVDEVDWIPGADSFEEAAASVLDWNDRRPHAGPHVIVPVHTDGCRRDRW